MQGYSGSNYDRFVERQETSTLHKFKETFWTTKQAVIQKLGKKEDVHVVASDSELDAKLEGRLVWERVKETFWTTKQAVIQKLGKKEDVHVVASDSELDAKLEVFKAIQKSCMELLRAIEKYQDRLCSLAQEENATGRFLKSHSGQDKTRAGKMMAAVGKSQSFAAQQRLSLRVPLVRLYQEVETFRYRAISDTLMTINRMEGARTEYRGALLWMKDVSEQLDPDTYKQLEKFRKVQAQVKKTKGRFDKLKLDVMQKVDLLAASRCNMFSHVLANYQSSLLHFWEKTSRTMTAVAESFKGYQYYEFSIIKELQEPAKKLSDSTRQPAERDIGDDFDPEKNWNLDSESSSTSNEDNYMYDENIYRLIALDEDSGEKTDDDRASLHNLLSDPAESRLGKGKEGKVKGDEPIFDFGEEVRELAGQYDFMENLDKLDTKLPLPKNGPKDLLSEDLETDDSEKDDMTILNEILNAPSTAGEDDFSREWQAVFGHTPLAAGTTLTPGETDQAQNSAEFMPSHLLDMTQQMDSMNLNATGGMMAPSQITEQTGQAAGNQPRDLGAKPKQPKKGQKTDMSAWFSLFADLDPLADPDSIGKQTQDDGDICKG